MAVQRSHHVGFEGMLRARQVHDDLRHGTPVCAASRRTGQRATRVAPGSSLGSQALLPVPPMGSAKRSNGRCALPHPSPPRGLREGTGCATLRPCRHKVGICWGSWGPPPIPRLRRPSRAGGHRSPRGDHGRRVQGRRADRTCSRGAPVVGGAGASRWPGFTARQDSPLGGAGGPRGRSRWSRWPAFCPLGASRGRWGTAIAPGPYRADTGTRQAPGRIVHGPVAPVLPDGHRVSPLEEGQGPEALP